MFIPWIIHGESVRLSVCLCILVQLTNWLVKSRVQNIKYRIMKKKTRRKRKLVYIPRRYLDLVTTKSRYLTSGIQLRVRDTINLLTWVNAESAYLVLGIRYWMVECWHLTNRIKIIKQCQHSGKWFNLYQKTSILISLIYQNEPFSLSTKI